MSDELLTSNTYALRGVMFQLFLVTRVSFIPAWQEHSSVENPLRHCTLSLTEVRNQEVPLYYLHVSLAGKAVTFFSFQKSSRRCLQPEDLTRTPKLSYRYF